MSTTRTTGPIILRLNQAQRTTHMMSCGIPLCPICFPPEPLGAEFEIILRDNLWELYERS